MKRIGIVWIVIVLLAATALSSCGSSQTKTYEKDFTLASIDDLTDIMLDRVELNSRDLNLSRAEQNAIEKYAKYGNVIRAATYEWSGKSERIEFDDSIYYLGADSFMLQAIAKILGINIEIEQMALNDALDKLETGQVDIIPGIYGTPELLERGRHLRSGTVSDFIYAYSTNLDRIYIDDITDMDDMRIGIVKGFNIMNDDVVNSLRNANIEFELIDSYITENDALDALENDEIDIIFQTFSRRLISQECYSVNISQIFNEAATTMMFTEKNDDIDYIMSAIEKIYRYNSGDYMKLLKQDYMDMYAATLVSIGSVFNLKEKSFIFDINRDPINVLALNNSEPYINYNQLTGEWEGISYEIWDAVTTVAGINHTIIQSDDDAHTILEKVAVETRDQVDDYTVVIPMYISLEKRDYFVFSEPVVVDKFVVVGLESSENLLEVYDLANRKVGVVEKFDSTKALRNYLPLEEYVTGYTTNDQLVDDLRDGIVDYIVLSEAEFNDYFFGKRFYDLEVKFEVSDAKSAIAFKDSIKGRSLQSIYNKVIPFIKVEQIINEHATVEADITKVMNSRNRDTLAMFIFMFLVVITFLGFFLRRLSKANKRVREIAFVNTVTGLQNRTAFYNDNTLATGSLIYVDIDNFKRINDVYGHDIADMYAYETAQRIASIAGEFGLTPYTMNINSFILLDDGTYSEDKLVSISAKILYEVTKVVRIYDVDHKMTASIGIAVKKDEKGMEELFKKVDTALFLAKERGKNRYVVASEEEFFLHRKKQFLNEQLTQETIQKEIVPYYQPKIDIRDGRIIGVEALARWNSKDQGMIYPDEIIPILSESDMLPILDISILTKACKNYMEWIDKKIIDRGFILSCNMSCTTIEGFDIVSAIMQIHDNIGIPYRSLEIEIKEQDLISNLNKIEVKLIEIAKLGVNISIDGFKADRAIMSQMSSLPVNIVKTDIALLKDGITGKVRELFNIINNLTRKLNMGLIVQGVETPEHIQFLKEIPIYRVQGFYYSKAIPESELEKEIRVKYIYR